MSREPRAWAVDGRAAPIRMQLHRLGLHPGGTWSLSWLFLAFGALAFDPEAGALQAVGASVCSALFAGLTGIGALAFAGRCAPLWILPAAFSLGLTRGVLFIVAGPEVGFGFAILYEPLAAVAAAVVVWRARLIADEPVLRVALTAALVAVAGLEVRDALQPSLPELSASMRPWFVLAPITAFLEVAAMWAWIRRRELRLEQAEEEQRDLEHAVSRERRANDLLRRKEAWLFDFFEKAPDLLIVLSSERCEILRCNRRFSESLGLPRRELVGRSLLELVEPSSREEVEPLLVAGRRRIRNLLLHLVRHDGSELTVLANLALRVDASGEREVRGVLHDVTRLERNEGDLRDLHRVLIESAGAAIFHADDTGRCAVVNASFCELTGLTPAQAAERSWLRNVHPDDRERVEQAWESAVGDRAVLRTAYRIQSVTGRVVPVVTECVPVEDSPAGGFACTTSSLAGLAEPSALGVRRRPRSRTSDYD